jgi:nucleoside-diphosphate-sugar epimerase
MKATIVGANGFIGSHLAKKMSINGYEVEKIGREHAPQSNKEYGTIIYCAGIKYDFVTRVCDLINAHITNLMSWLQTKHQKFIYLSSARIYMEQETGLETNEDFTIKTNDLYNQSKILAESVCTALDNRSIILRPSNVVGLEFHSTSFFWQIFKQALETQSIQTQEKATNTRDYIPLHYLLDCIVKLIEVDANGIYNVSSNIKLTNGEICHKISELVPISHINFGEKTITFPTIPNDKIVAQTHIDCPHPLETIGAVYQQYIENMSSLSLNA